MEYIAVTDGNENEAIELPVGADSTISLSTLVAQFPGATGLRYKAEGSRAMRGLKCDGTKFFEPLEGWSHYIYHVVYPKTESKRKMDVAGIGEDGYSKIKKFERKCVDLIVLGLPYSTTVEQLREYFGSYGELVVAEIKTDTTGKPKGFGFIRYKDYEPQLKVLTEKHEFGEKKVDVRIPASRGASSKAQQQFEQSKIFVGRVPQDLTRDALRLYFSQYCDVLDVYIPQPHRGFGFVTLSDPEVAEQLYDEDVVINGHSVHIGPPQPRPQRADPSEDMKVTLGTGGGFPSYGMYEGGTWSAPKKGRNQVSGGYGVHMGSGGGRGPSGSLARNMDQLSLGMPQGISPDIYQAAHAALITALASHGQGGQGPAISGFGGQRYK